MMLIESGRAENIWPFNDDLLLSFINLKKLQGMSLSRDLETLRLILTKIFTSWQILDFKSRSAFLWKHIGFSPTPGYPVPAGG